MVLALACFFDLVSYAELESSILLKTIHSILLPQVSNMVPII